MAPQFWHAIPLLVNSLTAFITSISGLKSLFSETRETDIWKMAKIISEWGPEYVIIEQDNFSNLLWDRNHQARYRLGPYQNKLLIWSAFMMPFAEDLSANWKKPMIRSKHWSPAMSHLPSLWKPIILFMHWIRSLDYMKHGLIIYIVNLNHYKGFQIYYRFLNWNRQNYFSIDPKMKSLLALWIGIMNTFT